MKSGRRIIRIFLLAFVLALGVYLYINSVETKNYEVVAWDNIYNENNLDFFYEKKDQALIDALEKNYKISEKISGETDRHEIVLMLTEYVKEIVELGEVSDTNQNSAYTILGEKKESKKVSQKDMAVIVRDFVVSQDIPCRVGEFRSSLKNIKTQSNYYVIEYWNNVHNKWVMVDFRDKGYFANKKVPCSAIEVLEYKIEDFSYIGNSSKNKYLKSIKNNLESYTISIDNTIEKKKSNTYLTYLYKEQSCLTLEFKNKFIEPTIYTQNKNLFNRPPKAKVDSVDNKAYLVLMKKYQDLPEVEEKDETSKEIPNDKVTIGAFKDGSIMESYYLRINGGEFKQINKYEEYNFIEGENSIELSIDGENIVSTIKIQRNIK